MNRGREVLVGAVILVGVTVAVVGSLWLSGSGLGRASVPVEVLVTDAGNLRQGNAVKYRGVPIGRVESIAIRTGGADAVRLTLRLDQDIELPDDAAALVAAESLFGEWQVELVSKARFPRFEFFELPEGATAENPDARLLGGFTLPDISRLTAAANEISENLAVLSERVDRAFNDETAEAFSTAIQEVQVIATSLRELVQQQASTVETVSTEVTAAATELGAAARAGRRTLESVDSIMAAGEVGRILDNLAETSESLASLSENVDGASTNFADVMAKADSTFARVDRLTARIEAGEGFVGQLLSDTTLVGQTSAALEQLELLLRDLRENPKRYVRLSIF